MQDAPFHLRLRDALLQLYGDERSARRVVCEAQIDPSRIDFSGAMRNVWSAILDEAHKQRVVERIVDIAVREYPLNPAFASQAATVRAARHNIPIAPMARFIGREQLLGDLRTRFEATDRNPTRRAVVALTGMGGVGKTQIALTFARACLTHFETVLWVDASGTDVTANFGALAETLNLGLSRSTPVSERARAVRAALEQGGPHLLVFDSVDAPTSYRALLPVTGETRVLFTTRRPFLPDVDNLAVKPLSLTEAMELFGGAQVVPPAETQAAAVLYEELGGLALALALAGQLFAEGIYTPTTLLERVRAEGPLAWSDDADSLDMSGPPGLTALFDTSFGLLDLSRSTDACALRIAYASGWFAPAPIARELLFDAANRLGGTSQGGPFQNESGLARLIRLGLVSMDERGDVVMHRLVQSYACAAVGEAGSSAVLEALAAHVERAGSGMNALLDLGHHRPHFARVVERVARGASPRHLRVALRFAQHLRVIAEPRGAYEVCAQALAKTEDDAWRAAFNHEMGVARCNQGHPTLAWNFFQKALDFEKKAHGLSHPMVAATLHQLGVVLAEQSRHVEAREYYEQALAIQESTSGTRHPSRANTLHQIGVGLSAQGHRREARRFFDEALSIQEEALGEAHPATAATLHEIGVTRRAEGDLDSARLCFERALTSEVHLLGDAHPMTSATRHELGVCLRLEGRLCEAVTLFDRVLHAQEAVHGASHPDVAATLHELGLCHQGLGETILARMHLERALSVRSALLGEKHRDTAATRSALGLSIEQDRPGEGPQPASVGEDRRTAATLHQVIGTFCTQLDGLAEEAITQVPEARADPA